MGGIPIGIWPGGICPIGGFIPIVAPGPIGPLGPDIGAGGPMAPGGRVLPVCPIKQPVDATVKQVTKRICGRNRSVMVVSLLEEL